MTQDPIEYGSHTWHTNLDTYERILEDDVKKDAVIVATALYQLAMRDDLLPRFSNPTMPPLPTPAATPTAAEKPATKTKHRIPRQRKVIQMKKM